MLRDFCTTTEYENDDFVGLKFYNGIPKIVFPRGYNLSSDENQSRKDILRLLSTIQKFGGRREGSTHKSADGELDISFPILSYQYIIKDFLSNGYYVEQETQYKDDVRGKISWKRTVQRKQPVYNNGNLVYLNFIVKTNRNNDNNVLAQIHKYCVRESFEKLGWLYLSNEVLPPKANIRFNKKLFISILNEALNNTFNTTKRMLFLSMINIINDKDESIDDLSSYAFGVNRFEYIWEKLIDYVFGEENKEQYFPHATWHIINGRKTESSALEPDTIMLYEDKLYILDAKYYKFGVTGFAKDLPGSSSIQKQITYGKYIAIRDEFKYSQNSIYNAFIMPFNKMQKGVNSNYMFVSVGTADWEIYGPTVPNYKYVLGILVDTRYVIESYSKHNLQEIEELSDLIVASLKDYRKEND